MTRFENLSTVAQVAAANKAFTEPKLRALIQAGASNGLEMALVRIGRRIFIDIEKFNAWLDTRCNKGSAR